MTQKQLLSSFLPFSFGVALTLFPLSSFAAETTTLPIATHTLKALDVPPQARPPVKKPEKKEAASATILSFSNNPQTAQKITPLLSQEEAVPVDDAVRTAPIASPAEENSDLDQLQQVSEDIKRTAAQADSPRHEPIMPLPPAPAPVHKRKVTPKAKPKAIAKPIVKAVTLAPSQAPLKRVPASHTVPSQTASRNPDLFELGGVRLGMSFNQARIAIANNLGIEVAEVEIAGTPPEAQTCISDTQLNAEGANGTINVQFACNAGLPLHHELSVAHISYEPASGAIENILKNAVKKYGKPVNLDEYNPLKADYVSYDWCAHPVPNLSSQTGKALHCPAKNESRLRLQGRDYSLEFQLTGLVGAAKFYQGEGAIGRFGDDADGGF